MKCISKKTTALVIALILVLLPGFRVGAEETDAEQPPQTLITDYELTHYNRSLGLIGSLRYTDYCVAEYDVNSVDADTNPNLACEGLFDLANKEVLVGQSLHDYVYPASVTKILTALLAIERCNMDDSVVISENADASTFPSDAQLAGLEAGEIWSLRDLLYGLLLYSGNDLATAIAEHVSGSEEQFVNDMNRRAEELYAVNTHFTNPHGLHDDDHYTTGYDLYLIFSECLKHEEFVTIIDSESYTAYYTARSGSSEEITFQPTNYYAKGAASVPDGVVMVGGKTGTTGQAGSCLILYIKSESGTPFISLVMGADTKSELYSSMTALMEAAAYR